MRTCSWPSTCLKLKQNQECSSAKTQHWCHISQLKPIHGSFWPHWTLSGLQLVRQKLSTQSISRTKVHQHHSNSWQVHVCLQLNILRNSFVFTDNFGNAFYTSLVSMLFELAHAHEHWRTRTHTLQHSWECYTHWVTWCMYNSSDFLCYYTDDFKTA